MLPDIRVHEKFLSEESSTFQYEVLELTLPFTLLWWLKNEENVLSIIFQTG